MTSYTVAATVAVLTAILGDLLVLRTALLRTPARRCAYLSCQRSNTTRAVPMSSTLP